MNNLLLSLKNSPKYLSYPFIFASSFLLLANLLRLFSVDVFDTVYLFAQDNIEIIFGACAVFFVSTYTTNSKKAFACAICYLISDGVFFSISNEHYSLLFGVLIAFILSYSVKSIDELYCYLLFMLIGTVLGIVIGLCYDYFYSVLRAFCDFMRNKEMLFAPFNNFYSIAFSDSFEELFFTKDYSMSAVVNGKIVSGVQSIFLADTDNPNHQVSVLLSGKYLVNIFVVLGIAVALYSHFYSNELLSFLSVCAVSILFGDIKLLSLLLLLFNPIIYLAFSAMNFISYLVTALLDIRIGYADNGSVIELFKYGNSWLYFLLSGIVIAVMTYFLTQIVISKFDIQKRKLLPKEVRKIINSLGGEKNIVKIQNDRLIVKNPNLINILNLDCDIRENEVILHYGELELLKQYY